MSTPSPGWYRDPHDAAHVRYWDGSNWTEHVAPAQPPAPVSSSVPYQTSVNPYDNQVDLFSALSPDQREQYMRHSLTTFPTWLAVVLHIVTLGLFSVIYQGLKLSKLPLVKSDDFTAGKGIGFCFIPFFNLYWLFRFVLSITDRLNFQFRLRGQPAPISRDLALASCILRVIPYLNFIGLLILEPIVAGQWQSATNRLVRNWGAQLPPPATWQDALPPGASREPLAGGPPATD
jgi:hypothetical protein